VGVPNSGISEAGNCKKAALPGRVKLDHGKALFCQSQMRPRNEVRWRFVGLSF
jgi:hypothetical protein